MQHVRCVSRAVCQAVWCVHVPCPHTSTNTCVFAHATLTSSSPSSSNSHHVCLTTCMRETLKRLLRDRAERVWAFISTSEPFWIEADIVSPHPYHSHSHHTTLKTLHHIPIPTHHHIYHITIPTVPQLTIYSPCSTTTSPYPLYHNSPYSLCTTTTSHHHTYHTTLQHITT